MKKIFGLFLLLLFSYSVQAQEINASVTINAERTGRTQLSVFNTLQKDLQDFVNKNRWSSRTLPRNQRVNCSFFITVNKYTNNNFEATIQIQASRPVFESSMVTPIFNFMDQDFNFSYEEHEPLSFSINSYESNLISTVSFYVYVILGLDADTFEENGGEEYFSKANQIAGISEQKGGKGWNSSSGRMSRYEMNQELQSSSYQNFHEAMYEYHRQGLDLMHDSLEEGKNNIVEAINLLEKLSRSRPNTVLIRSFFDAKAGEITDIFTGGPDIDDIDQVVKSLNDMAPNYSRMWSAIK